MTDVKIAFDVDSVRTQDGKPVNRVYPSGSFDLFAGEQLVVVGRYKKAGNARVVVRGKIGGREEKFDFPAKLVEKSSDDTQGFIEKLWAVRRVGEILDELDLKGKNDELIKELVKISTRHGILTPYTSFMADENTNVRDLAANIRRADLRLEHLAVQGGESGVAQRMAKGSLQRAIRAPTSRPVELAAPAMDAFRDLAAKSANQPAGRPATGGARLGTGPGARSGGGRGGFGMGGGMGGGDFGGQVVREAEKARQTIRNIGNRTFYQRKGQWVDSQVTDKQEASAKRIKQFSDEYFALARRHGRAMSQYLVFDEPVLLNLDNQAYLIEP